MTFKELIIQELDLVPESLLEQILNFIRFLKFTYFRGPAASATSTQPHSPSSSPLSDTERLEQLNQLFGSWANQPDLDVIFETIAKERRLARSRDLDLDAWN